MTTQPDNLSQGRDPSDETQPELFPTGTIEERIRQRELFKGEYTLERFRKHEPEKLAMCIHLLAAGYGRLRIASLVGCCHHTVKAVADAEPNAIAIERDRMASMARHGGGMLLEGIVEDIANPVTAKKIPFRDKAVAAGILVDKSLILAGQASIIIGEEKREFTQEDMNAYLDDLPRVEDESIPIEKERDPSGTGTGAAAPGQKVARPGSRRPFARGESGAGADSPNGEPQFSNDQPEGGEPDE